MRRIKRSTCKIESEPKGAEDDERASPGTFYYNILYHDLHAENA